MPNRASQVFFFETFQEEQQAIQRYLPKNIHAAFTWKTIQASGFQNPPADFISIRTQSNIPTEWISSLQGILSRSSGYDHLLKFRREIPCGYLPNYCSRAVAEQALLLTLGLLRKLPLQLQNSKTFTRDGMTGQELRGKRLLVLGVGHVGREVVKIAHGLEMSVRGVDLVHREKNVSYTSFRQGLSWAQIIICCLPLTSKTNAMLNYKVLKNCRKGVFVINVARGEITPLVDMAKLLGEGCLGGLGLDVYENEPEVAEALRQKKSSLNVRLFRDLLKKENVLLTPHNAFNTEEALERKARESVDAVKVFLHKKTFPDMVPKKF